MVHRPAIRQVARQRGLARRIVRRIAYARSAQQAQSKAGVARERTSDSSLNAVEKSTGSFGRALG